MKWVGLSGGIATGKSTVSKMLRDLGLPVVDADALARAVTGPNTPGLHSVVNEFGREVLDSSGTLDRAKLGKMVFSDPAKRVRLEAILHPLIQELRAAERRKLEQQGCEVAFYDVPLLFEKDLEDEFDATILVYAKPDEQRARMRERDHLEPEQIEARLNAQLPIDDKVKRANYVIFNQGSMTDLKLNVQTVLSEIIK